MQLQYQQRLRSGLQGETPRLAWRLFETFHHDFMSPSRSRELHRFLATFVRVVRILFCYVWILGAQYSMSRVRTASSSFLATLTGCPQYLVLDCYVRWVPQDQETLTILPTRSAAQHMFTAPAQGSNRSTYTKYKDRGVGIGPVA